MKKLKIYFHKNTTGYTDAAIEWEVEQKNLRDFYLQLDGSFYNVSAIQPYRHIQEVQDSIERKGFSSIDVHEFIIKDVSRDTILRIVPLLIKEGFLNKQKAMTSAEVEDLELTLVAEIDLL